MPNPITGRARIPLMFGVLAVGLLLSGCGGDEGSSGSGGSASSPGEAVFEQSCARCHGNDLRGTSRGPSLFSEVYEPGHHSDAAIRAAIETGSVAHHWEFGDMPAVRGLEAQEIDAVIGYIRTQQEANGFETYPPG